MQLETGTRNSMKKQSTVMEIISADKLPKKISFKFNCRQPSKASRAYKNMREQLNTNPEMFVELNSGITIANNEFILDGGHTYKAIEDSINEDHVDPKRIRVKIIRLDNLSPAEMARTAVGLNTKVTPPLIGERDLEGAWDKMKRRLDSKYKKFYEFRPNSQPGAPFKVDMLVALLHGWTESKATRCYSSKGLLVRLYSDDKYEGRLDYLNTAIEFFSYITKDLTEDDSLQKLVGYRERVKTILTTGEEIQGNLPQAYIWPIYGAYHSILDRDHPDPTNNGDKLLKFLVDIYKQKRAQHIKTLLKDYQSVGRNPTKLGKTDEVYLNQMITLLK